MPYNVLMSYTESIEKTLGELSASKGGLSDEEASKRLGQYGANTLVVEAKFKILKDLLAQFTDLLAIILIIAGGLSYIFGETRDAIIIFFIVLANAAIGFFQEYKAEKAIQALKKMIPLEAIVLRGGEEQKINASDIVPGDIIILDEGDNVPVDIRLIEANDLFTNDTVLTGESEPQSKFAGELDTENLSVTEIDNTVFMGTSVISGNAIGVVVGTGMNTEFGKIAHLTQEIENTESPLQKEVRTMAKTISLITLAVVAAIFGLGLFMKKSPFESFGYSLGIAASTVPEGLAATISVALAVGVQRMARSKSIIKRLSAVETLGCATVIVTDKTGTLTKNEMTVKELWANGKNIHVKGVGNMPVGEFISDGVLYDQSKLSKLLEITVLCDNAELEKDSDEGFKVIGDSTEGALLVLAEKARIDTNEFRKTHTKIDEVPFDSTRKMMSTINSIGNNYCVHTKGAPLEVLAKCTKILIDDKVRNLVKKDIDEIKKQNDALASEALRVLGFAYREIDKTFLDSHSGDIRRPESATINTKDSGQARMTKENGIESDLIFVGLVGMIDPPKAEVEEAIDLTKKAGLKVIMVTGDYQLTAKAIGIRIGLAMNPKMISGSDLNTMSKAELKKILKTDEIIFARVDPEHKMRIVSALQDLGHIVVVTGDGVNDAPALKKADIGVAMGITGTDVSKESAEMIVTDDNFSSIVSAIKEGRIVYDNIKRFLLYILSSNSTEFFSVIMGFFLGVSPILAIQILFVDLGTDVFPSMALAVDKGDHEIMFRAPRDRKQKLLSKEMLMFLLQIGLLVGVLAAIVFSIIMTYGGQGFSADALNYKRGTTAVYAVLVLCQVVNAFMCRGTKGFFRSIFGNTKLLLGVVFSLILLLFVVYNTALQNIFYTAPLKSADWILVLMAALIFWGFSIIKRNHYIKSFDKIVMKTA